MPYIIPQLNCSDTFIDICIHACMHVCVYLQDSLRRQESILAQRSVRVEELKVAHQNVSIHYNILRIGFYLIKDLYARTINTYIHFIQLVDQQRKYFSAVKEFQVECNKNEWLNSKLESAGPQET